MARGVASPPEMDSSASSLTVLSVPSYDPKRGIAIASLWPKNTPKYPGQSSNPHLSTFSKLTFVKDISCGAIP